MEAVRELIPKVKECCFDLASVSNVKLLIVQKSILERVDWLKSNVSIYDRSTQTTALAACMATCVLGFAYTRLTSRKSVTNKTKRNTFRMKGLAIESYDGFEGVSIINSLHIPEVKKPDDILIRVVAASIDVMDFRISCGYNKRLRRHITQFQQDTKDGFPIILGRDCVGIVLETGEDATEFAIGDEVWAISPPCHQGYMSQVIVVSKSFVDYKPFNLSFEEAAVLPYSAVITWSALAKGELNATSTKTKRVLIHDGTSPVGSLAIQLVKLWGGHVTTTIAKAAIPVAINLGVNDVVVHDIEHFAMELKKRKKFDVVLNTIGMILHDWCKEVVTDKGIVISMVAGRTACETYGIFFGVLYSIYSYIKSVFTQRIILGNDTWLSNTSLTAEPLHNFRELLELQKIRPILDSVWSLENYEHAFRRALHPECIGKVVIRFN